MATVYIGSNVTISRTEAQEPNIIDVTQWDIYRVINSVQEISPIETITVGNGITRTDPVGDEGAMTYSVSVSLEVGVDLSDGDTLQWLFIPGGTEGDLAGTLDWQTDEYDVSDAIIAATYQSLPVGIGIMV